jgi:hypothetical protein
MPPVTRNTRVIGGKRPVYLAKPELKLVMDFQKNPEQYQYRPGLADQSGRNRGYRIIWPVSSALSGGSNPVELSGRSRCYQQIRAQSPQCWPQASYLESAALSIYNSISGI